ncbi:MAG TPA: hypothetical protein VF765_29280 [Polyangiaceae bacterium]
MSKRKPTARNLRREATRTAQKLARDRERLARLEPGGTPERPIEVESASQIEPHAMATTCLRCDGPNRVAEHAAATVDGERLRCVHLVCSRCGARRELWFRITAALPS